jgi:hypothetical protein
MPESRRVPIRFPDEENLTQRMYAAKDLEIEQWKARAWDLTLSNDLLRLALDVVRAELLEEKAKNATT